ncbi:putative Phosphoprotein phosphatase [Hibiscus syriacus]|uniref:Phosphoprotein phosphatase n=1 Tax=Hibiscus syriacus TaxID=106335 RepID=A0A6A3CDB9_HIBSY|nr:disease resistance protein At4g27190-like [Hibiscus syriacus]KAE8725182.1 putative Phosphoprotein phosphatase [Hibiscus syriacus]
MRKIQEEIAEKLGMTISENSIDMRAARLRKRLGKENRVLIILDDIWKFLDIGALGIPSADQHKGCKILITSRKLDVLNSMGSQKSLPIDVLKEDEAWNLFKDVAGPIAERSDLQSTAMKVAQKCAGLPLAITTVSKALKHKENLSEWKDALERLKPSEINSEGITAEAYSAIEMSYRYLEREELKYTFLLCSIMDHDAAIEDLLKYCRGLGLFHRLDTIEKVRDRVLTLVNELIESSLLLAGSTSERFDMHDVVRDVAISITSRDLRWLALGKEDVIEEWKDTMRNSHLVSLKYAKVSELPDELECPDLTFFSTDDSVEVPDNFFKGMQRLNVLEFDGTNFTTLPFSLGFLKTLCTLRLIGCDVEDIAILGELENLEILDLRCSGMKMLPKEIGQLTKLKLLDLSDCDDLEVIPPNVLSKLSKLE